MSKKPYTVTLQGCGSDSTTFAVELTAAELRVVELLEAMSEDAAEYSCQPILVVEDA